MEEYAYICSCTYGNYKGSCSYGSRRVWSGGSTRANNTDNGHHLFLFCINIF